ncbi:PREDICTED: uncharacterized protein LOC108751630 isoform X1 [Trachymyrmex septentrionalis]|uniref:uncharacterized protein LOC108751630 isoform X1 n=2 Tax=Trachymyrmex septentrionalis TaxID=34720 RepID=UPI00084EEB88|nr:PREDICTED: uncharacterized protein LOC108751630 isoform X1 [Trachymyrmex septentrionalis]
MTEPENQTEDEAVTSDFLESGTEDVTTDDQIPYKSTDDEILYENTDDEILYENTDDEISYKNPDDETNEDTEKNRSWMDKRSASRMKSSKSNPGEKSERKAMSDIMRPSNTKTIKSNPLNSFEHEYKTRTTVGLGRSGTTRIWRSLRARQPTRIQRRVSRNGSERLWPSVPPLFARDTVIGLENEWEEERRRKRRDIFLYDSTDNDKDKFLRNQQMSDFANRKELGHIRVPVLYSESRLKLSVDCAVGDQCPGLVDGDYMTVELPSKRVYAYVVLHGLKGMHLLEISSMRERKNTWKFCFYQAIVALLAKTQLRYKYVRSACIDYIYDHAWMLFTHIGSINVKAKQRLDDVVVYNYKYSVEVKLIGELKDVEARFVTTLYKEPGVQSQITLSRKDPLRVEVKLGCEKVTDSDYVPVHKDNSPKELERWLDQTITDVYRDYILRTTRFSLAFWQDGLFWYLYNPYRCDKYGFWEEDGFACIVKFCSKDSLRRHLMILMLRAHAFEEDASRYDYRSNYEGEGNVYIDVELFHVSFRYCQLDNLKLLQRGMSKQPRRADGKNSSDTLEIEDEEDETGDLEEDEEGDPREPRERAIWLKCYGPTTWGKCASANRKRPGSTEVTAAGKARWHRYYVEEPNRLFSLWGGIHITDDMFDEANRGMQTYACYVVCAGMTRIMAPEYWTPKTLDTIVVCGDRYYTHSKHEAELKSDGDENVNHPFKYLCDSFDIGEIVFEARMLPAVSGRLYVESDEGLWRTLERVFSSYHFAALTCESACLGLFKFCGAYYVCDVNSSGPPFFRYGDGAAYLLRATSFRKFMTVLVLIIGSSERSRFSLNPIEILRIVEVDTALDSRRKPRDKKCHFRRFRGRITGKSRFDGEKKKKRMSK